MEGEPIMTDLCYVADLGSQNHVLLHQAGSGSVSVVVHICDYERCGQNRAAAAAPAPPYVLHLSRLIWNLRARAERGEPVARELLLALAERERLRGTPS